MHLLKLLVFKGYEFAKEKTAVCLNPASTTGVSATGTGLHLGPQGFLASPRPQISRQLLSFLRLVSGC